MLKNIITVVGVVVISFVIFVASFKVPDLLKNKQISKDMPPNDPLSSSENKIDEKKWRDIWLKAMPGTELSKLATQKLTESGYFDRREKERISACDKALALAQTSQSTSQWLDVWFHSLPGSQPDKLSREKLEQLGYFKEREKEKEVEHQKAQLAANVAKTEDDWNAVWLRAIPGSELDKVAKEKLEQFAYFQKRQLKKEIEHKDAEIMALNIAREM